MNSYWAKRIAEQQEALLDKSINSLEAELLKKYRTLSKSIILKLKNLYLEIKASKEDGTLLVSDLYRYNKYYETLQNLQREVISLGGIEVNILDQNLVDLYTENYSLLGASLNLQSDISRNRAEEVVKQIWAPDNLTFSDRVWADKEKLITELEQSLVDTVSSGQSTDYLTKTLIERFNVSYSNASRLVRTELAHIQNKSTADKFVEAGISQYKFLATEDERECEVCGGVDGKVYELNAAMTGINFPPMHPNCRCSVLAVISE